MKIAPRFFVREWDVSTEYRQPTGLWGTRHDDDDPGIWCCRTRRTCAGLVARLGVCTVTPGATRVAAGCITESIRTSGCADSPHTQVGACSRVAWTGNAMAAA